MMKIKFDNVGLNVPESWKDIKLSDYEKWYLLNPESNLEMVQYVADICKIDARILMDSPPQLFNLVFETMQFIFDVDFEPTDKCNIEKVDYFISTSNKLTLAEYVDVESVLGGESKNKLSEMLAILCRPINEKYNSDLNEERIELFKNLSCDKALPLISFFLFKKKKSDEILNHYLTATIQAEQFLKDTETFVLNGDGIKRFPIWQRIRYIYLTRLLKKRLLKSSDSYFTKLINQEQRKSNTNLKNK